MWQRSTIIRRMFVLSSILFFWGVVSVAQAQVVIDVNWNGQKNSTLQDRSFAPGDSKSHDIKVTNDGEIQDLYFKIDKVRNNSFADKLNFYLIDKSSGKYYVGGAGDRFSVKELGDEGSVFVERLDAGESNRYIVKVRFDKDTGNAFQGQETKFDMTLGFKGEPTTSDAPLPLRPGQVDGGNEAPEGEVLGAETTTEEGAGENNLVLNADGDVRGAADEKCVPWWPWWLWFVVLVGTVLLGAMTIRFARSVAHDQGHRITAPFVIFTFFGIMLIILWYILEHCHTQ